MEKLSPSFHQGIAHHTETPPLSQFHPSHTGLFNSPTPSQDLSAQDLPSQLHEKQVTDLQLKMECEVDCCTQVTKAWDCGHNEASKITCRRDLDGPIDGKELRFRCPWSKVFQTHCFLSRPSSHQAQERVSPRFLRYLPSRCGHEESFRRFGKDCIAGDRCSKTGR